MLPGVGGKSFPKNCEKTYFQLYCFWIKFSDNFLAYLGAPNRAAAAPKGAPTRLKPQWSCQEWDIKKCLRKIVKNIFSAVLFLERIFLDKFLLTYLLPIVRQLHPKVPQLAAKSTEAARGGRKKFSGKLWKSIFRFIISGENVLINFAYLAAPYRAAAAPKRALTRSKTTEAARCGKKIS